MDLIGQSFNLTHGGGITTYRVSRAHCDAGYFECVAVAAVSGSHHFLGGIEIMSRQTIESLIAAEKAPLYIRRCAAGRCYTADFRDTPEKDKMIGLFGATEIPLPWTDAAAIEDVIAHQTGRFPEYRVIAEVR